MVDLPLAQFRPVSRDFRPQLGCLRGVDFLDGQPELNDLVVDLAIAVVEIIHQFVQLGRAGIGYGQQLDVFRDFHHGPDALAEVVKRLGRLALEIAQLLHGGIILERPIQQLRGEPAEVVHPAQLRAGLESRLAAPEEARQILRRPLMKRLQVGRADIGPIRRQPFWFEKLRLPLQHLVTAALYLFGVGVSNRCGPNALRPFLLLRIEHRQFESLRIEEVLELAHAFIALVEVVTQLQERVFARTGRIGERKEIEPVAKLAQQLAEILGFVGQGVGVEVRQPAVNLVQRVAQLLGRKLAV